MSWFAALLTVDPSRGHDVHAVCPPDSNHRVAAASPRLHRPDHDREHPLVAPASPPGHRRVQAPETRARHRRRQRGGTSAGMLENRHEQRPGLAWAKTPSSPARRPHVGASGAWWHHVGVPDTSGNVLAAMAPAATQPASTLAPPPQARWYPMTFEPGLDPGWRQFRAPMFLVQKPDPVPNHCLVGPEGAMLRLAAADGGPSGSHARLASVVPVACVLQAYPAAVAAVGQGGQGTGYKGRAGRCQARRVGRPVAICTSRDVPA